MTSVWELANPQLRDLAVYEPGKPIDALAHYPGAVLVIGGASDRFTPPDETRRMYDAATGSRTLWIVPGESHEGISDLRSAEYRDKVLSFFEHTIGVP